jgi:hypothetical protein
LGCFFDELLRVLLLIADDYIELLRPMTCG